MIRLFVSETSLDIIFESALRLLRFGAISLLASPADGRSNGTTTQQAGMSQLSGKFKD